LPDGRGAFAETLVEVVGAGLDSDAPDDQSYLRISVADADPARVGREFSSAVVATALGSYPGLYLTTPPGPASEFMIGWPTLIDVSRVQSRLRLDADELDVPAPALTRRVMADLPRLAGSDARGDSSWLTTVRVGDYLGARSGDKGGNANLGLWVRDERHLPILEYLTDPQRLSEVFREFRGHQIKVYPLPNLLAVNVVIVGLLGSGVAASLREDPQAKSLGERFRAVRVAVPAVLVPDLIATEA
jgi:hypothetical protein